ncbi:MAG: molybdopterin-dependent oxidoreductase [Planctomycetaceae bacterium]|nr:molybdopterin-dependent oxidoreductase [Planctomycetaceae bacterium]
MSLYSPATDPKYQPVAVPAPNDVAPPVIISADTRRTDRLPEGQHRTRKWPVLHATSVPQIDIARWSIKICGLVDQPLVFSLEQFRQLPRIQVFADFHCVTSWSRLGNLWEGVSVQRLLAQAGVAANARYAVIGGCDNGWTTNVPLAALDDDDVVLADLHDRMPLDADHGGPVRLVIPKLFAWKSAKWVNRIELTDQNIPGYWEQAGYHNVGDPWKGQRYRDDPEWKAASDAC